MDEGRGTGQAHDLDVAPHGSQDIHIHLVSAISTA